MLALALAACGGAAGDARDEGGTAGARAGAVIPAGAGATSAPAEPPARDTMPAGDTLAGASGGPGGRPTPLPMPPPADTSDRVAPGTGAGRDTARGIVAIVGAAPLTDVVLRTGSGAVRLAGAQLPQLRRLAGVELWVRGTPVAAPRPSLEVAQFTVRAVDGVPALDGVLAEDQGRVVLVTADGRRQVLDHPPAQLRDQLGARVWITGTAPGEVASYGVIRD